MKKIEDYSDDELVEELEERGYDFSENCQEQHCDSACSRNDDPDIDMDDLRSMAEKMKYGALEDIREELSNFFYETVGIVV
jgi:hypothetical protein